MLWWQVVLLSVVEGITEFLPISSTGHLIVLSNFFNIEDSSFRTTFEISIQVGAILSVLFLYWRSFLFNKQMVFNLILAFLPVGIVGFVFYNFITTHLLTDLFLIAWALIAGGVIMIISEYWYKKQVVIETDDLSKISYKKSIFIGCCQVLALIPGVSRSAATITGGLWTKISRKQATEFSFLLAVPVMITAGGYDFWKQAEYFSTDQFSALLIGVTLSFLIGLLAIKSLLAFIKHYDFIPFGVYRIIVGLLILLLLYFSII